MVPWSICPPSPSHCTAPLCHRPEQMDVSRSKARVAANALAHMLDLTRGPCAPLVEAVIAKYIALSPEEIEEWRDDPESYVRSAGGSLCLSSEPH